MKETKFITSDGLAFFEAKDMKKLHKYSLKGWHVKAFNFMGYTLEKGEKVNYTYSIDYQTLKKEEKEDYLSFFLDANWTHVTSAGNIHLFRAESGTTPIYTDKETTINKYQNLTSSLRKFSVPLLLLTIVAWSLTMMTSGNLHSFMFLLATIFSVVAIPMIGTLIAAYKLKWKEEEKSIKVNMAMVMPSIFIFIALTLMLLLSEKSFIVNMLLSMIIGAIGFPLIIYIVMSLYHKVEK